jgi:hypothetical protein
MEDLVLGEVELNLSLAVLEREMPVHLSAPSMESESLQAVL